MFKILTITVLFMVGSVEAGDRSPSIGVGVGIDSNYSSTVAEGYLRGRGAALTGRANYLEALGNYQNIHQQARSRSMSNWAIGIRTRWSIIDERKARRKRPSYIERRMLTLDRIEARALLTKREDGMRAKGLLPPKPEPGFTYRGLRYLSYAEFKKNIAYQHMIVERDARQLIRDIEKLREKIRYDAAVRLLAKRSRMDPINRVFNDQRVARNRRVRSIMGHEWWDKYMGDVDLK